MKRNPFSSPGLQLPHSQSIEAVRAAMVIRFLPNCMQRGFFGILVWYLASPRIPTNQRALPAFCRF
jgi:hypothetical protein